MHNRRSRFDWCVKKDRLPAVKDEDGPDIGIVAVNADQAGPALTALALRTLARLLVRAHSQNGDRVANEGQDSASSTLTSSRHPRTHPGDEAA